MKTAALCIALLLTACGLKLYAAGDAWPPLPKGSLTITNLGPRPGVKSVKTDSYEVRRDGKRVASITRVDRNGDGKFEEFVFTAFVEKQRVVAVTRIGGTNESAMFFSFDDVMVMTDVRIPESDVVALVVMSKEHGCYEIFARQSDGYYWPADDAQRTAVDAFFRAGAKAMSPLFEKLKR
jgi:outer membrane lipopolysaccharide assembly protein LptE/RlpB